MTIPSDCAIPEDIPETSSEEFLKKVAAHIIVSTVLDTLASGQTLLAHNIHHSIAEALTIQAANSNVTVTYTTDSLESAVPGWWKLPQYLGPLEWEALFPSEDVPDAFLGLSPRNNANEDAIIRRLQHHGTVIWTAKSTFSVNSTDRRRASTGSSMNEVLRKAVSFVQQSQTPRQNGEWAPDSQWDQATKFCSTTPGGIIQGLYNVSDHLSIVNWTKDASLPIRITRLDSGPMFKGSNTTYWIVGMSGALGISVADWMIHKGARSIVMTSRHPNFEPEWIRNHRRGGAIITALACDVADEKALRGVHHEICKTLPPIRGVIHGAMVLRDVSISNMSFDNLLDVVQPKVNGSLNLDNIFFNTDLDFFVVTSSITTVIANPGQANYAAANAFMCSLAARRRKRGLRAAAVNGGAIIGAGYMERETRGAWDRVAQNAWMMRLSEDDFVQSICEGIEASRLDSTSHGPEISTGLQFVPIGAENAPFWASDPKFSAFLFQPQTVETTEVVKGGSKATASIQCLLQQCTTAEDVLSTVQTAFADMLRITLQISMSEEELMAAHGSEIGLDSLVSVNIRSWFLKHLQVGIPVLKIMSNEPMQHLVRFAVDTMPTEMAPQLLRTPSGAEASLDTGGPVPNGVSAQESKLNGHDPNMERSLVPDGEFHTSTKAEDDALIDWEIESRPPDDLLNIPLATHMRSPATPPRCIVLTGASGLFGRHLLTYLSSQTSVQKIICIAVRDLARRLKEGELASGDPRVEYYAGDLAAPLLGLSAEQAAAIFGAADAVIHNGADTSHMKPYRDVRRSNVGSTLELARLCLPRRVPLHYVSSAGLAVLYGRDEFPPVSVTGPGCARPARDGSFGYASTKWTCEALLEQIHARYGGSSSSSSSSSWPVCIHRPSTIVRSGEDATASKASFDWVNMMLHHARELRCVPRFARRRGSLDLVSAQTACERLVARVMLRPRDDGEGMERDGGVAYVHLVGDRIIPLDSLEVIAQESEEHEPFGAMSLTDWTAKAVANGLHPAVAVLIEMMDEGAGSDFPRLLSKIPAATKS
ncbi:KR domain-containing protein [Nemania sp. FL0916]|nr:KR domain-containing protein [Nemania sp. FL0916]